MSLIVVEDQSPIMRRAKIRVVVAIVLLLVATGSLLMLDEKAPTLPASTKTAKQAVKPKSVSAVDNKKTPAPALELTDDKLPAKPPTAPPDPVYSSFTAQEPVNEMPTTPVTSATKTASVEIKKKETAPSEDALPKANAVTQKSIPPSINLDISSTGNHILQAGVFGEMNNAKKQRAKLTANGIDSYTETKLRVGPFSNSEDAEAAREKIRTSGIDVTLSDKAETGSRGLVLMAGQYADMENAKRLQTAISELGLPVHTETRLLVGPFVTKAKADAARNRIKNLNISVVLMPNN